MLLVCIFSIIILGIIIVKRPRTIIWMGRYIRNKLLLLLLLTVYLKCKYRHRIRHQTEYYLFNRYDKHKQVNAKKYLHLRPG